MTNRYMARCSGKRWLPLTERNASISFRPRNEVWLTYANLIDYSRIVVVLIAVSLVPNRQPMAVASLLLLSFILDWVDGPTARYTNQCTYLGSSLDWFGDILTNVLQVYWFAHVSPAGYWADLAMWAFLFIEIGYMMTDTICYAQGRYPDVSKPCLSPLLRLSVRPGTHGTLYMYTDFYTLIWIVFPLATASFCIERELGHVLFQQPSTLLVFLADIWLATMWTVGAALCLVFIATEFELLRLLFSSWNEPRDAPKELLSVYSDIERSIVGGCAVFRAAYGPLSSDLLVRNVLPTLLAGTPTATSVSFEQQTVRDSAGLLRVLGVTSGEWSALKRDTFLVRVSSSDGLRCAAPIEHLVSYLGGSPLPEDAAAVVPPSVGPGDVICLLAGSRVRLNRIYELSGASHHHFDVYVRR
jgi:phosphatidylglycerophosphate synthase